MLSWASHFGASMYVVRSRSFAPTALPEGLTAGGWTASTAYQRRASYPPPALGPQEGHPVLLPRCTHRVSAGIRRSAAPHGKVPGTAPRGPKGTDIRRAPHHPVRGSSSRAAPSSTESPPRRRRHDFVRPLHSRSPKGLRGPRRATAKDRLCQAGDAATRPPRAAATRRRSGLPTSATGAAGAIPRAPTPPLMRQF